MEREGIEPQHIRMVKDWTDETLAALSPPPPFLRELEDDYHKALREAATRPHADDNDKERGR